MANPWDNDPILQPTAPAARPAAPSWQSDPIIKPADPYKAPTQARAANADRRADSAEARARAAAARAEREWNATHNPDGSPKPKGEAKLEAYSQSAMDSFDRALNSIETLKKHPGFGAMVGSGFDPAAIGSFNPFSAEGRAGKPLGGTAAAGFSARLKALQAQLFLPMVQSMKGMGALSNAEGEKLTAAVGALDPSMPEADFLASMDAIKADLTHYRNRAAALPGNPKAKPAPKGKAAGFKFLGFE